MKQVQIIDENQAFNSIDTHWGLEDVGFNYHVVAVFGSQSTGKSTLLNHLFGTEFDVMNSTVGRAQTTKGIWISRGKDSNILVMDVEGTDGRERGDDQDFERKSALFSMATAEVVIVNMWENAVGLYNGANMSLLRTVMEVNLQLFQKNSKSKTLLYFVIRDSTGQTSIDSHAATLKADLEKIWMGISKPVGKETAIISDYFEFAFTPVAHKIYAFDKFKSDLELIKKRFYEEGEDFCFKPKYHKGIPADGFPMFARSIWEKIVDNRDLDLPTQQQLLAQFRCDEIAKVAFTTFTEKVNVLKQPLEAGKVVEEFGTVAGEAYGSAIESFVKDGQRYHSETFQSKKQEFSSKMLSQLQVFYLEQLRNLLKHCMKLFDQRITEQLRNGDADFGVKIKNATTIATDYFEKVEATSRLEGSDWVFSNFQESLTKDIDDACTRLRQEAINRITKSVQKLLTTKLSEPVTLMLLDAPTDVWSEAISTLILVTKEAETFMQEKLLAVGVSDQERKDAIRNLKFEAWSILLGVSKQEVSDTSILDKLRRRFESHFRFDEKGLPRVWKPADDIDGVYSKAKEETDTLLLLLSKITVNIDSIDSEVKSHEEFDQDALVLISPTRSVSVRERFSKEAESLFVEAKRSTVVSRPVIPPWFIVLTVALGWNELLTILRNPMLTLLFLIVLGGSYLLWYTNLGGPAYQVAVAGTAEFGRQVKHSLKDRGYDLDNVEQWRQKVQDFYGKIANPAPSESIELQPLNETSKTK